MDASSCQVKCGFTYGLTNREGQQPKPSIDRSSSAAGLILDPDVSPHDGKARTGRAAIDNSQIRFAILYWDELAWPITPEVSQPESAELDFLESREVLKKYTIQDSGDGYWAYRTISQRAEEARIGLFNYLTREKPDTWSILGPFEQYMVGLGVAIPENADAVTLFKAIPIPDKDVPLDDILLFKERRRDELLKLRETIRATYSRIRASNDRLAALGAASSELDAACADMLRAAQEWRNPFRLGDLKFSLEVSLRNITAGLVVGEELGKQIPASPDIRLPLVCAVIGAATSCIKISRDVSLKKEGNSGPYRYVYRMHKEIYV